MFETMRTAMIDRQLRTAGVNDQRLLAAFAAVRREAFVPPARAALAYADGAVEIAPGRWLMAPMSLGLMLNHAQIQPDDRALVVGAGTGYGASLLIAAGAQVTALEEDAALAAASRANGVTVVTGPLTAGWPAAGPYDLIVCDGGVSSVPPALIAQVADGGRIAAIVIGEDNVGRVVVGRVIGGHYAATAHIEAGAALLPGFGRVPQFTF